MAGRLSSIMQLAGHYRKLRSGMIAIYVMPYYREPVMQHIRKLVVADGLSTMLRISRAVKSGDTEALDRILLEQRGAPPGNDTAATSRQEHDDTATTPRERGTDSEGGKASGSDAATEGHKAEIPPEEQE